MRIAASFLTGSLRVNAMEKQGVLRSIAKYCYCRKQDLVSQNLSRFVLSAENPYGIGNPNLAVLLGDAFIKEDCDHESLNFFGIGDAAALLL